MLLAIAIPRLQCSPDSLPMNREALESGVAGSAAVPEHRKPIDAGPPLVRSLAWNGFWTVAMTSSGGLIAVLVPPFLVRTLTHDE
jgi:hypothetical protein